MHFTYNFGWWTFTFTLVDGLKWTIHKPGNYPEIFVTATFDFGAWAYSRLQRVSI